MAPRRSREETSGNLGRNITTGKEEEATKRESHAVGDKKSGDALREAGILGQR